ncbi:MAG TPA: TIGR04255 family protein [Methanothrix sp.]|nr:TIGR04255 family protein [Methanothrix sp.]
MVRYNDEKCEATMVTPKIYSRPTVRQVIFQIRYPNLFYLESKIGDMQQKIMRYFPKSELIQRQKLLLANVGPDFRIDPKDVEDTSGNKIWKFESKNNVVLNITTNSLDMTSEFHKTYDLGDNDSKKFKKTIELVVGAFIELATLPIINRIGLRYIDFCPLPAKNNETIKQWYNSKFPIDRFEIADAQEMAFRAVIHKNKNGRAYNLGYMESLGKMKPDSKNIDALILDFDGSISDIDAVDYLSITDDLHILIAEEYHATIKQPVYDWMEGE